MKIAFLTKKEKLGVQDAIKFLNKRGHVVDVFYGDVRPDFPKEIIKKKYDILVSYISNWIVPNNVLNRTKLWNINFHPGPPEYPGTGCFNFAIYNDEDFYGGTAHLMNKSVDSGDIIGVYHFKMNNFETVQSLSEKTYKALLVLFKNVFNHIFEKKNLPECSEKWKRKPYMRKELEKLATLDPDMNLNQIKKIIRATYFPGKPAPFIEISGLKFEYNPDR